MSALSVSRQHLRRSLTARCGQAALGLLFAGLSLPSQAQSLYWINGVPDLDQRRAALPNNGGMYCVPTSNVNWLYFIANHGYPAMIPGSNDPLDYVHASNELAIMGLLMGTSPTGGTGFSGAKVGAEVWLNAYAPGNFIVWTVNFLADDKSGHGFNYMMGAAKAGLLAMPCVGWYSNSNSGPGGTHTRNGGHMVSMTGGFDDFIHPNRWMRINDPANDENPHDLNAQSPFHSEIYNIAYEQGWFGGNNVTLGRVQNYGSAYLDGFMGILPIYGLCNVDNTFHIYHPVHILGLTQPPDQIVGPAVRGNILDIALHPNERVAYYLVAGSDKIWSLDLTTGRSASIAQLPAVQRLLLGGPDTKLYALLHNQIVRLTPEGQILNTMELPYTPSALAMDQTRKRLIAFGTIADVGPRIYYYDLSLKLIGSKSAPSVEGSGPLNMSLDDAHNVLYLHTDGARSVSWLRYNADGAPETGRTVLEGAVSPMGLHADDWGYLLMCDGSVIVEYDSKGQRVHRSPFDGLQGKGQLQIARSFNNFDPATTIGPAYNNVLPNQSISGVVTLVGCVDSVQNLSFELRPQGGGAPIVTNAWLASDGAFNLFDVPAGKYILSVKGAKWLRRNVGISLGNSPINNLHMTLLPGDANDDNVVDVDDLGILAATFNTGTGERAFDERADFTCDNRVDLDDLGLLSLNFNLDGDP